jgi:NAD(P)-dependent dehydrogenase (short-subunit alcohol dehydrogenase family)
MVHVTKGIDFTRLAPPAGSNVLIVGGCGAVGRPLVTACLNMGMNVTVLALPRSLEAYPPERDVHAIAVDATDESSMRKAANEIGKRCKHIDVLVFLVGFMTVPPLEFDELHAEEWDAVMSGNLRSAYITCRTFLPLLRAAKNASVVTVGSSLGYNPIRGVGAYASAKAGLTALTKAIAIENAPHVRANLVAPSAIDTDFLAGGGGQRGTKAANAGGDSWFRGTSEDYVATIPMKRIAVAEDIVGPILFLAGPAAAFITGQVLHVNGGRITP